MTENEELLKKLFAEKDFKPNDAQYRAITHIEGPLFLTAGPGSGKTDYFTENEPSIFI